MKPEISLASHIRISDEVLARELGDEMVLLDLKGGVYFSLDAVGARVWHLLQCHGALHGVLAVLVEEYDVTEARCAGDLLHLITEMRDKGLVEVSDLAAH